MTTVNLSCFAGAGWQFFNNNGVPLAGGFLYTYSAGTTTPIATYTSNSGSIANSNPIILDSSGRVPYEIWLTLSTPYKFVLQDSSSVQIGSWDNIPAITSAGDLSNQSNVALGDALVGFEQSNSSGALSGAVGKTVHQKLQEWVSVKDFGAVGDGNTQDGVAIQNALNALSTNSTLYFPAGVYLISQSTVLSANIANVTLIGDGATLKMTGVPTSIVTMLTLNNNNITVKGLSFTSVTNSTYAAPTNGYSFTYLTNTYGINIGAYSNILIDGCTLTGLVFGIYSSSGTTNLKIVNNTILNMNYGFTGLTAPNGVIIDNNYLQNVGSLGGMQLYGAENFTISNNYVFAAGSTGINPGGSASANQTSGVISSNVIFAQLCVAVENGIDGIVISNNVCNVTEPFPNGVGIGIDAHDPASGYMTNLTITDNIIRYVTNINSSSPSVNYQYGLGITVTRESGAVPSPSQDITGVVIANNQVYNAAGAYKVTDAVSTIKGVVMTNNIGIYCSAGIYLASVYDGFVNYNHLRGFGSTLQSGTIGFNISSCTNILLDSNRTEGFYNASYPGGHYAVYNSTVDIRSPIWTNIPGDSYVGNFITTSGTVNLTEWQSDGYTRLFTGPVYSPQGSNIASATTITLPSNGNYFLITGTTSIQTIVPQVTNPYGMVIYLRFESTVALLNQVGNPNNIQLAGSTNYTVPAGTIMGFIFGSKNGNQWQEISRSNP
jgi:Pectate lyase superfamily protein